MSRRDKASWREQRWLAVLGLPTLALALGITTVSAYVPLFLEDLTGPLLAGAFIATEGVFALFVPSLIGRWSDRTSTRIGGRLPYLLVAAPIGALALVAAPYGSSLLLIGAAVMVFYIAYFAYFSPYMALYPDLVPERLEGRSQGSVGAWREVGLGLALVGGGLLVSVWRPLPFVFAAVVLLGVTVLFTRAVIARAGDRIDEAGGSASGRGAALRLVRESGRLRAILAANALWETALNALRAFVLLFFVVGLGRSTSFASAVLGFVAVAALVAAPISGALADRLGNVRTMRVGLWVYAAGVAVPMFIQSPVAIAVVPFVAFAAATVMTLPFSLVMSALPDDDHGTATGLFAFSRGLGLIAGPLLAGLAVSLLDGVFTDTKGYAAIFGVASLALFASIPLLHRAR